MRDPQKGYVPWYCRRIWCNVGKDCDFVRYCGILYCGSTWDRICILRCAVQSDNGYSSSYTGADRSASSSGPDRAWPCTTQRLQVMHRYMVPKLKNNFISQIRNTVLQNTNKSTNSNQSSTKTCSHSWLNSETPDNSSKLTGKPLKHHETIT